MNDFFYGSEMVWVMGVDNVDVFEVEVLEGGMEVFDDVFVVQVVVVDEDFVVVVVLVEFGVDDDVVVFLVELFDGLVYDDFGLVFGVVVEIVLVNFCGLRVQRCFCVWFLFFCSVKKVDI